MRIIFSVLLISIYSGMLMSCKHHNNEHGEKHDQEHLHEGHDKEDEDAAIFHPSANPDLQDRPFSEVVQAGDFYFLSGKIGTDPATGKLVEGGIEAETKQTLENIKAVLEHHGLGMTDVVKAMVVLDDINDFAAFNAVYVTYLPQKPARTTFAAEALAIGSKIEIEVVAYSGQ